MKIVFIRHGKTQGNLEKRYMGITDESLCAEGIKELQSNIADKKYQPVDQVFVSPMKRCLESASLIYKDMNAIQIPEFKEMDFGDFEGKNYSELNGNPEYQAWIESNGTLPFPNGESREAFEKRCMLGFEKMLEQAQKAGAGTIAAVVHGGTIMAVLSGLGLGNYFDFQIKNGQGYVVELEAKKCSII